MGVYDTQEQDRFDERVVAFGLPPLVVAFGLPSFVVAFGTAPQERILLYGMIALELGVSILQPEDFLPGRNFFRT